MPCRKASRDATAETAARIPVAILFDAGEKVAPAEVEAAICQLGGVLDVAVVGVPDPEFGQVAAALIVAKGATLTLSRCGTPSPTG
jgi:acyl-CoA synthetase (AMP-forming)/AMP-acid ligase II